MINKKITEHSEVGNWDEFREKYYEIKPAIFSNFIDINKIFNLNDLFHTINLANQSFIQNNKRDFSIWINGRLTTDVDKYGPKKTDENIVEYIERLTSNGQQFTYSLNNIQKYDPTLWLKSMNFIYEFIKYMGVPSDEVDIDTFFGKYDSTPRGIHTDQASTIMTVLHGKKTMLLWPSDYFENRTYAKNIRGTSLRKTLVGKFSIDEFLEDAIILEGSAGDTLYWPAGYWHTSYSREPEANIVMNLGFFYKEKNSSLLNQMTEMLMKNLMENSNLIKHHDMDSDMYPTQEIKQLEKYRKLLNKADIEFSYKDLLAKRNSSGGFKSIPDELMCTYDINKKYKVTSCIPIIYFEKGNELHVYIHGRKKIYVNDFKLIELIIKINKAEVPSKIEFNQFYNDLLNSRYLCEISQ